ncbi:transcription factor bHLH68-like [Iris pallida]|uniref:Transcription factor bHLH68-like n=1 Tax=Iris pallida TaxID=29817 RepID=A0AAX6IG10_IRIPA|nr:transcription factor bHLH68-like [Iris pallida]
MNRGALQSSPVHQMAGGSPIWWDLNNMSSPLFPTSSQSTASSSSSSSVIPHCTQPYSTLQAAATCNWHDSQELPESWSQLLLGGLVEEEERCSYTSLIQAKRMENWEDHQVSYPTASSRMVNVENELSADRAGFLYGLGKHEASAMASSWSQILPNSSPRSCVTTSFNSTSSSMLDFSRNTATERKHRQLDHSSECNSTPTGSPYKKARVQAASAQSTLKVRKEKLGDRVTALHQLVSPFGKTDTASVLLEAIGYIRFLQSQIEALSSPYLVTAGSGNNNNNNISHSSVQGERSCIFPDDPGQLLNDNSMKPRGQPGQDGDDEQTKDLRSRGLCLVPVSFIMHVGNDNAADYWAPTFGGGYR